MLFRSKKRKLDLYSTPPKSPILPKKTGKTHKVKTNPDQWISREPVPCPVFEKEPLLPLRILNARRNAIFFRYPPVRRHRYSPSPDSSDTVYVLDQKFRMRSLDQIDFLFRLGASSCFYIKKQALGLLWVDFKDFRFLDLFLEVGGLAGWLILCAGTWVLRAFMFEYVLLRYFFYF